MPKSYARAIPVVVLFIFIFLPIMAIGFVSGFFVTGFFGTIKAGWTKGSDCQLKVLDWLGKQLD